MSEAIMGENEDWKVKQNGMREMRKERWQERANKASDDREAD